MKRQAGELCFHTLCMPRFACPEELLFWLCMWVSVTVMTVFRAAFPAKLATANRGVHQSVKVYNGPQYAVGTQNKVVEYD